MPTSHHQPSLSSDSERTEDVRAVSRMNGTGIPGYEARPLAAFSGDGYGKSGHVSADGHRSLDDEMPVWEGENLRTFYPTMPVAHSGDGFGKTSGDGYGKASGDGYGKASGDGRSQSSGDGHGRSQLRVVAGSQADPGFAPVSIPTREGLNVSVNPPSVHSSSMAPAQTMRVVSGQTQGHMNSAHSAATTSANAESFRTQKPVTSDTWKLVCLVVVFLVWISTASTLLFLYMDRYLFG